MYMYRYRNQREGKARPQNNKRKPKKSPAPKKERSPFSNLKEGAFTAQAKRAGMSVKQMTKAVLDNPDKYTTTTVRRAQFAKNFGGKKKKK